jgi:hypothetical protein
MKKSDHFNEDSWQDEEPAVTPGFNLPHAMSKDSKSMTVS